MFQFVSSSLKVRLLLLFTLSARLIYSLKAESLGFGCDRFGKKKEPREQKMQSIDMGSLVSWHFSFLNIFLQFKNTEFLLSLFYTFCFIKNILSLIPRPAVPVPPVEHAEQGIKTGRCGAHW